MKWQGRYQDRTAPVSVHYRGSRPRL